MIDRNSIRFRVAMIVTTAVVLSLGGFSLFLSSQIRGINEREETAKLQNTNQLVLNMIAQTDSILRQQTENWAHAFTGALAGEYSLETGGEAKFQVRPVEGIAPPPGSSDAELLILDGQQRLTTLTQVLAILLTYFYSMNLER